MNIDLSDVLEEISLTSTQSANLAELVVKDVVTIVHARWSSLAKQGLNSTRNLYANSLRIVDKGRFAGSIVLMGRLPNMLESGVGAFDMKNGFRNSPKAKKSLEGDNWYITIPFRFATPSALGENAAFNGGKLPSEIYKAMRQKRARKTAPNIGVVQTGQPLTLPEIPKNLAVKLPSSTGYIPKSTIFEGLTRNEKEYENTTQSSYVTFRRVSLNSDPNSWIHSGLTARNFAEKALDSGMIENTVNNTITGFLEGI